MSQINLTRPEVEDALSHYIDPCLGQDLISAKVLKNIEISASDILVELELHFAAEQYKTELASALSAYLEKHFNRDIKVEISWNILNHAVQTGLKPLPEIKNIIAIASGKGGVGKSTTAANIALALYQEGAQVGLLDADIYGPNQPQMLGIYQKPESHDNKSMEPIRAYGLQTMSIGYLVDENTPMIWRGPMVSGALQQLLNDTHWQGLDYLIVDLPPGTGDVQLTMAQKIPVSGAVIVTTPQDVALLDVRKALAMFQKVSVPILGVVENMSTHICQHCGMEEPIFGQGGGELIAEQYHTPLLGRLPLDIRIREQADKGTPIVITEIEDKIKKNYQDIARKIAARLSLNAKDYQRKFPKIEIQNR